MAFARLASRVEFEPLVRVHVWELPVRLAHWTIVFSIVVLSFTGWYLHEPFTTELREQAWTMATMRFIHVVTAFAFSLAVLVRVTWFFVGNRWAYWRAFVPVTRSHLRSMGAMLRYYLFLRWRAPEAVGHNRLAALTYLVVYALLLLQVITGFALYGWIGTQPWAWLFGWVQHLIPIQYVRELHYFLMFMFFGFTIHHVYSALLVAAEEKNGLMGSIVSGDKFIAADQLRRDMQDDAPSGAMAARRMS